MLRNARTWIALAVIAGGITAAVMLPKEKTPSGAPERQGSDDLVRRDFDFEEAIAQAHDSEPAAAAPPATPAQTPLGSGPSPLDVHSPPPRLDDSIPDDGGIGQHRLSPEVFQDLAQRPMGSASADDDPYAAKEPIQHKIIDGDTLRSLAKRYLGEESRYLEIFEANREQLSSPEVLPIGAELLIPLTPPPMPTAAAPRVEAAPVSLGLGVPPVDPSANSAAPMVEIPPGSLRAVPAEAGESSRTYRVKEGDTLVSIARRLYGDGAKYREIFEANREVLTSPNRLPTGVLLQIP